MTGHNHSDGHRRTTTPRGPYQDQKACDFSKPNSPAIIEALENLGHYHLSHTEDTVTRWRTTFTGDKGTKKALVFYIASDPEVLQRLADATASEFPPTNPPENPPPEAT